MRKSYIENQRRFAVEVGSPDAEGWITVRAVFDSLDHARTQILGFGTHAEALHPPELCTIIIETAEALVQFHAARRK